MKKKIILIVTICIVIFVAVIGILFFMNNKDENNSSNLDKSLENLELTGNAYKPSVVQDKDGNETTLADFSDKPMVLLFFSTTEETSTESLEILKNYYEEYKNKINFVVVSVIDGVTETKETVEEYITSSNIQIPVVYDTNYTAKEEYEISTVPTFVFVNKNQEVINKIEEDINDDVIEANLDILAENY